jgi:hypothetical protein
LLKIRRLTSGAQIDAEVGEAAGRRLAALLIVIGVTAFTLQWLMDERPPRERRPAGGPAPVPA